MSGAAKFLWFWTFWRWSGECYRAGILLRDPIHGFAGNWNAWFNHEASAEDRALIADLLQDEKAQRQFIVWIYRRWSREVDRSGNRLLARFIITRLSLLTPFDSWPAFKKYKTDYGAFGVCAIVLTQGSDGEAEDVREMEALILPDFSGGSGPKLTSEGFQADATDLSAPRQAALHLFRGKSLTTLLMIWGAVGTRPYPRWLKIALTVGWLTEAILILFFLIGPDAGMAENLTSYAILLVGLWTILSGTALIVLLRESFQFYRDAKFWAERLERSQIWLKMTGGLTLRGGSAGLAFCLNILLACYRAHPNAASRSWIWKNIFRRLRAEGRSWAATGVIGSDGRLTTVVLEPKIRACILKPDVGHLLTPKQIGAKSKVVARASSTVRSVRTHAVNPVGLPRLGYAAVHPNLALHPCPHLPRALLSVGALSSLWQLSLAGLAVAVSATLFFASRDLKCILLPPTPPAPIALTPSPPGVLWVGLKTDYPDYFEVVLESDHWISRRVGVELHHGAFTAARAEVPLTLASHPELVDSHDGTVWIERRQKFLWRKFQFGERVGQYSVSYPSHLGQ